jgi:hypothetical protein
MTTTKKDVQLPGIESFDFMPNISSYRDLYSHSFRNKSKRDFELSANTKTGFPENENFQESQRKKMLQQLTDTT